MGLTESSVNVNEGTIDLIYETDSVRDNVIRKLSAMGYPEATEENGLLMQAKSYANCMIGKSSVLFADAIPIAIGTD